MFERISNGWALAKQSWRVLMLDKEMLVFPLLSGIACLIVLASFGVPILMGMDQIEQMAEQNEGLGQVLLWGVLFLFYFANYFVIVFFNSALVACAIIRFRGGDPTVMDGLRTASHRMPQIVAWALVSATVGIILRAIESRSEKVGQIVSGLLGGAWSIATYFVVPVLVVEQVGPVDAVRRSFGILKKAWGESLAAGFSIGLITFLLCFVAMIPVVAGVVALEAGQTVLAVLGIAVGAICLMLIALINSALDAILLGALYLYAADGEVPEQFDGAVLEAAFHRK